MNTGYNNEHLTFPNVYIFSNKLKNKPLTGMSSFSMFYPIKEAVYLNPFAINLPHEL